jgi:glycosyltransferase involved in cell wall biosynthesis
MAAALPVVATDVGGMREVVQQAQTGLLAPAGDPAPLAALLGRVLDDPDLARQLGRRGQERAREVFDDDRMLAAYRDLYTAMCGARVLAAGGRSAWRGSPDPADTSDR